jgi:Zn-dependent protease with chaperone function
MSMRSDGFGPLFEGRYSDGRTASAADVEVRLGSRGIEIGVPGQTSPLVWPYGALKSAEPLTAHAIDALLTYTYQPDATLFVPDGTFARQLALEAPHLTARAMRIRHAQPWLWAAAGVVAIGVILWLLELSPSRAVAQLLPDRVRSALGSQVVQSMVGNKPVCENAAGRAALDRLTARLSKASGASKPFHVVVVDWSLMNAFAAPGEQIVLTRGLLAKAGDPDEIAGVLAHEMGHGLELHPETGIVRAMGLSAATDLLLGGSSGLANLGLILAQLSYTRAAEHEADLQALRVLKGAEISPRGLASFFERVARIEDESAVGKTIGGIGILRTPPLTEKRRELVEIQPVYPATPSLTADDWSALKAICGTGGGGSDI